MALVPAGMANAQGAALNQFPSEVFVPTNAPLPIPVFPPSELVTPAFIQNPSQVNERVYQVQITASIETDVFNPATSLSSIGIRTGQSVAPPGIPPFNQLEDVSFVLPFDPPNTASGVDKVVTLSGRITVPAGQGKSLCVALLQHPADTSNYVVMPDFKVEFYRVS